MTKVEEVIEKIEEFAPKHLAEDWDPIGLSIGSRKQKIKKMMIALDLDANTLKEAKEKDVDFIFTHHPAIFGSLKTLNEEDNRRKEYIKLIRSEISLYSAHTNIDAAKNGMNDWLAEAIGLERPYQLMEFSYKNSFKKITYSIQTGKAEKILDKLDQISEGNLSKYNPSLYSKENILAIKEAGQDEEQELLLDLIIPKEDVPRLVNSLYELNAPELPNYYLTAIEKESESFGMGRVASLKEALSMEELIKKVKEAFSVTDLRISNLKLDQSIKKVAILGGSGEKYYEQALAHDADVYITGDISYHGAQDMMREGLAFIDPGHFIENIFVEKMTEMLEEWNKQENWEIEIIPATQQEDVFLFK